MSLIERVSYTLREGQIALIALAYEDNEEAFNLKLSPYKVEIIRYSAEVVACEIKAAKELHEALAKEAKETLREAEKQAKKVKREVKRAEKSAKLSCKISCKNVVQNIMQKYHADKRKMQRAEENSLPVCLY
ncbi:MAG: hypothetical protein ACI4U2_01240 [Christensenellaceae bacterium]